MVAPLFPVLGDGFPQPSVKSLLSTGTAKNGSITLPGDIEAGELLIVIWSANDTTGNAVNVSDPAGWTVIDKTTSGTQDGAIGAWYKIAATSDAGAGIDCSSTTHEEGGYALIRVQNKGGDFTSITVNTAGAAFAGSGSALAETDIPEPTADPTTAFLAFAMLTNQGDGNRTMSVTPGGNPIYDFGTSQTFDIRAYLEVRLWVGPVKGNLAISDSNTDWRGMIVSAGISIK
jgi:hypothetical protein